MQLRAHALSHVRATGPDRSALGAARLLLLALAFAVGLPLAVRAEEAKEEVLIGTFELRGKQAPSPRNVPESASRSESEVSPAEIYAAALRHLEAGDHAAGQRQLELLVARFPQSPEAALARLRLAQLYAGPGPAKPAAAASSKLAPAGEAAEPDPLSASDDDGGWSAEIRTRVSGVEDRFRTEVADRIFFVAGSAELGSRARGVLAAQAAWMQRQPQIDAVIEGHADDPGSADENRTIALARAEAVRRRLIEEGVAPDRLRVSSLGRGWRVAECDGAECAAHNRRAVTLVYTRGTEPPGARVGSTDGGDRSTRSADLPGTRRARR